MHRENPGIILYAVLLFRGRNGVGCWVQCWRLLWYHWRLVRNYWLLKVLHRPFGQKSFTIGRKLLTVKNALSTFGKILLTFGKRLLTTGEKLLMIEKSLTIVNHIKIETLPFVTNRNIVLKSAIALMNGLKITQDFRKELFQNINQANKWPKCMMSST